MVSREACDGAIPQPRHLNICDLIPISQSLPQLLARVLIQGSQILGKAFVEAGRQAGRNLRATPESANATAGARPGQGGAADAKSDQLTRTHRMTVEEARMILNVKAPEGGSGAEITEEIRQQLTKVSRRTCLQKRVLYLSDLG